MRLRHLFATPRCKSLCGTLLLFAAFTAGPAELAAQPAGVDSLNMQLRKESKAFFTQWSKWWEQSQTKDWFALDGKKLGKSVEPASIRGAYQHCHARQSFRNEGITPFPGEYEPIISKSTSFSICPSWLLSNPQKFVDAISTNESDSADAAINPKLRPLVRAARAKVIDSYAAAQKLRPNDIGIVGQHIRFLLDQGLDANALDEANRCDAPGVWCQLLRGYVRVRRQEWDVAAVAFDSALKAMPDDDRCAWLDISPLLPEDRRRVFESMPCAEQEALNKKLWWLADPMYTQPHNERLSEHLARLIRIAMLTALPGDGRFEYQNKKKPDDALRQLVNRYGWPTYLGWGGPETDASHDGWIRGFADQPQPPYTTYEYSPGRVHTFPSWNVLDAPFTATDAAWDFYGNAPENKLEKWWPVEHMSRVRKLAAIPEGQIALMRRDTDVLLATANNLTPASFDSLDERPLATFILTPSPDSFAIVGRVPVQRSAVLRQQSHIPNSPALLAIEMSSVGTNGIDVRSRRGIQPPLPLNAMTEGEIAISEPALFEVLPNDARLIAAHDSLLNRLLGSTTISLATTPRIGVYWESYGIRATDTVSVSVRIERREILGTFRRIGMALNVANDPNSSIKITWREPDRGHVPTTLGGLVPVQLRTVSLDLSSLTPGPYALITEIVNQKKVTVTSTRKLTLVR